ncbi:hypothetical protein ACRE1S_08130 [Helicobacter himalayensis]
MSVHKVLRNRISQALNPQKSKQLKKILYVREVGFIPARYDL